MSETFRNQLRILEQTWMTLVALLVLLAHTPLAWGQPTDEEEYDLYKIFSSMTIPPHGPVFATPTQEDSMGQAILDRVHNHPVLSIPRLAHYDPSSQIGFCFGRAMAVHLALSTRGYPSTQLRKLFAIGELRSNEKPLWRFHVTTSFYSPERAEWMVLDPYFPRPQTELEWMRQVQNFFDRRHQAYFYVTSTHAVLPDLTIVRNQATETGDRIIELPFRPSENLGFLGPEGFGPGRRILVSPAAELKYFSSTNPSAPHAFSFQGLSIRFNNLEPAAWFGFNHYFSDLLRMGVQL